MDPQELNKRFDHHPPVTEEDILDHELTREAYKKLAVTLTNLPPSRETSLAFTALEESSFWAQAAIARARA